MSRFSSRKCGRLQRFTQSNLGCFLCPPEMTPSLPLSLLPFHPIVEKLHFRGLLAVSHPIPRHSRLPTPCYGSRQMCIGEEDTPILRFPLFTYFWSCSFEARGAYNRSPVYCAMLNSVDRQTKMMGISELCNRQPLRLVYESPRHGVHMQIANEGFEGRRRMTLPYWQSCQVLP